MKESGNFDLKSKLPLLKDIHLKDVSLKIKSKKESAQPAAEPEGETLQSRTSVWEVIRILGLAVYRLRALFMAIPVIYLALRMAAYNSEHLPLLVGLDLQSTGEFARTISRQTAVTMPLFLTGGCLVLMCFSRKTFYPWLISLFTLLIPVLLLVTNLYPA